MPVSLLKISFFVGDEVCRGVAFDAKTGDESQILRFLKDKLETPYVVSYFFNRLLRAALSRHSAAQGIMWAGVTVVLSEQVGVSPILLME